MVTIQNLCTKQCIFLRKHLTQLTMIYSKQSSEKKVQYEAFYWHRHFDSPIRLTISKHFFSLQSLAAHTG